MCSLGRRIERSYNVLGSNEKERCGFFWCIGFLPLPSPHLTLDVGTCLTRNYDKKGKGRDNRTTGTNGFSTISLPNVVYRTYMKATRTGTEAIAPVSVLHNTAC